MNHRPVKRLQQNLIAFSSRSKKVEAAVRILRYELKRQADIKAGITPKPSIQEKWAYTMFTDEVNKPLQKYKGFK